MLSKYGIKLYASAQNKKQAEHWLFLQIKSGRILNIYSVGFFNKTIKNYYFTRAYDYYDDV